VPEDHQTPFSAMSEFSFLKDLTARPLSVRVVQVSKDVWPLADSYPFFPGKEFKSTWDASNALGFTVADFIGRAADVALYLGKKRFECAGVTFELWRANKRSSAKTANDGANRSPKASSPAANGRPAPASSGGSSAEGPGRPECIAVGPTLR
jgi:hypothetical protein